MLAPSIHWVTEINPLRLALMPRPRSGEWLAEEITAWHEAGIRTVVSLLEPSEIRELDLRAEADLCAQRGISFLHHPIPDRGVPSSSSALATLLAVLRERLLRREGVAIHCRAGIGRTGLVAACLLNSLGDEPADAFPLLSRARGVTVPDTPEQVAWVKTFSRSIKGAA